MEQKQNRNKSRLNSYYTEAGKVTAVTVQRREAFESKQ